MALSNFQIEEKVHKVPYLNSQFVGVFSKDDIPECKDNHCFIFNIQDSKDKNGNPNPGTHWMAAGIKNNQSWCFDSFGLAPPKPIHQVLQDPIVYNSRQIQGDKSELCGYFALAACCQVTLHGGDPGESLKHLVDEFTEPNLENNDKILKNVLHKFKIRV